MNKITVVTVVKGDINKVWEYFTAPEHITQWAFASDDWEARAAENEVQVGGRFKTVMAAKDGSSRFDFTGTYANIIPHELIEYEMDKGPNEAVGRRVEVQFIKTPEGVEVVETFDPESENTEELQRAGWQAILDNFKKHVESN